MIGLTGGSEKMNVVTCIFKTNYADKRMKNPIKDVCTVKAHGFGCPFNREPKTENHITVCGDKGDGKDVKNKQQIQQAGRENIEEFHHRLFPGC